MNADKRIWNPVGFIVGSGIAGTSTALSAARNGLRVALKPDLLRAFSSGAAIAV